MEKLRRNLFILLASAILVSGWLGWFVISKFYSSFYSDWYPVIPAFFFFFGLLNISLAGKTNNNNPRKPVNLFLLLRLLKFLLSFTLLGIYYLMNGRNYFKEFALIFAIFYFLYLALETYFFYRTEKELKKTQK